MLAAQVSRTTPTDWFNHQQWGQLYVLEAPHQTNLMCSQDWEPLVQFLIQTLTKTERGIPAYVWLRSNGKSTTCFRRRKNEFCLKNFQICMRVWKHLMGGCWGEEEGYTSLGERLRWMRTVWSLRYCEQSPPTVPGVMSEFCADRAYKPEVMKLLPLAKGLWDRGAQAELLPDNKRQHNNNGNISHP